MFLAGGNNYREGRWFTAWDRQGHKLFPFQLDPIIAEIVG